MQQYIEGVVMVEKEEDMHTELEAVEKGEDKHAELEAVEEKLV